MKLSTIKHSLIKFWLLALVSIGLFIGGFFVPPLGIIDGSVLKAGGILLGFYVASLIPDAIRAGRAIRFTHGDSCVEISDDDNTN